LPSPPARCPKNGPRMHDRKLELGRLELEFSALSAYSAAKKDPTNGEEMMRPIISLENVTYTHFERSEPALLDLNLSIPAGTLTLVVGPSGSGKSTLCNVLSGAAPNLIGGEFEGRCIVDGKDTQQTPIRELAPTVGWVFQDAEVMFSMLEVEDEVAFGPENLCLPPEIIRRDVDQMLDYVGLTPHRRSLVWELSGGQIQKLGLACALVMHPQIVILDEPTANLDPVATQWVHDLVLDLQNRGTTVVLVTKELDEFMAEANQMVVLNQGQVVAVGPPNEVIIRHGLFLSNELGVWLPETTEIGLALQRRGLLTPERVPIRVEETLEILRSARWEPGPQASPPATEICRDHKVLIHAQDLSFAYSDGTEALKSVSFDIHQGELMAIVGRNGAGKSTLARLIVGLLRPEHGDLTILGRPAQKWNVRDLANHIGLVFQNPEHQFLTDTVRDEIAYSLLAQGIDDPEAVEKHVRETLHLLEIEDVIDMHPFALSAGAKRRLGVATMLVGNPQVLIVDEPTYGQDRAMTRTLMALLTDLRERGVTIVMITHDMRVVEEYTERVLVMSAGEILFDGSPGELFDQGDILEKASLRTTGLSRLVRALRTEGYPVPRSVRSVTQLVASISTLEGGE